MFQIIEGADAAITTTATATTAAAIAVVDCSRSCGGVGSKAVPMMMMGVWSKGGHRHCVCERL